MHTGLSVIFQNLDAPGADREMMRRELDLIARAEERGFDSVWIPEHHFAGYTVAPNVPMVLAWAAAHSTRLRLGTMVTVLPWHDPVRVVENFALLDHLSDGRAMLGIGRGLGRKEFDGLRQERGESRRRFTEYAEAILPALETGVMEYHGDLYDQPRVEIRPTPFESFRGRTFASAVSPESMDLMIALGCGLMVIAQKPWETTEAELRAYREAFLRPNGEEAPKPIVSLFVGLHERAEEAQRIRDVYLTATWNRSPSTTSSPTSRSPTSRGTSTTASSPPTSRSTGGPVQRVPGRSAGVGDTGRRDREAPRVRRADRRRRAPRRPVVRGHERRRGRARSRAVQP